MKIIITAGGTGGHIYPALSVIEKLKSENHEILYIGTKDRMESELIPSLNINYKGIEVYGLTKNITKNIKNIKCLINSYKECKKIIKEFKPDYVIGFGGYVTFPVLKAANKLKIKTAIHEQNQMPGKSNKMLSKFANVTFVSFPESKKYFKNKVIVSGNPCTEKAITEPKEDKTKLGFTKNKNLIIIVMGSLGSEIMNKKLKDYLQTFDRKDSEILFITGKTNYEEYKNLKVPNTVKIESYHNNLSALMKDSNLIISRAGASTISEILATNTPSILVPSPYVANNHQYYNALPLHEKGLSIMIEQENLTTELLKEKVDEVLKQTINIKNKLNNLPKQKSSTIIVEEITK